jgi:serine/threonine-protein kinase
MPEPEPQSLGTSFANSSDPLLESSLVTDLGSDSGAERETVERRPSNRSAVAAGDPLTAVDAADQPPGPERFAVGSAGRNLLYGEIGRGGMGAVLKGRDPDLGRDIAVKVLLGPHCDKPEFVRRFLEEAQISGQLQHPGTVPVYEMGRFDNGRPYFTMKLVKGHTLAELLAARANPTVDLSRFLTIFEQVCQTLAYAHAQGVIHRDVKPANVMVGSFGEVQVMDWGLAKVLRSGSATDEEGSRSATDSGSEIHTVRSDSGLEQTRAGMSMGTPQYIPPEQARGEVSQIDERADVFGLAAVLCVILTGKPPYVGTDFFDLMEKTCNGDLADGFARLNACGADAELVQLCKDCLAPQKTDRPRHAGVLAQRLAAYQAGVQQRLRRAELHSAAALARAEEERKRRKLAVGLAVAVLSLVVAVAGGGLWVQQQRAAQRAEEARREEVLRQGVGSALEKVAELQRQGHWAEARAVLDQAQERLGPTGPEDLLPQIEQARRDLDLVDRLEAIHLLRATIVEGKYYYSSAAQDYAAVFREARLGEEGEEAEAVAARVRDSAIREQLVAALDSWALAARDGNQRAWLLGVARHADPDAWRDRFRDPAVWRDRAALEGLARELLADAARLERLSPQLLLALWHALRQTKAETLPLLAAAQALHPDDFWLNFEQGNSLYERGKALSDAKKVDEAVGYYRGALAVRPKAAAVYNNLGLALQEKQQPNEAVQAYRHSLKLDPNFAHAHYNLGTTLYAQWQNSEQNLALLDEAIEHFRKGFRSIPKRAEAHYQLGTRLHGKWQLSPANLALRDEVIQEYRQAIALDPDHAAAHYNLSLVLRRQGQFTEALAELRKGYELDLKDKGGAALPVVGASTVGLMGSPLGQGPSLAASALFPGRASDPLFPVARVSDAERLAKMETKLLAILEGKEKPADAAECLALAQMCQFKNLFAASVRFYSQAFAHDAQLADDLPKSTRYNAACAAALTGCGQGEDAGQLDDKERARLRRQALDWLKADLALWIRQTASAKPEERAAVQRMLNHWQADSDLAGLRDDNELKKLPAAERDECRQLWADVAAVLEKANGKK